MKSISPLFVKSFLAFALSLAATINLSAQCFTWTPEGIQGFSAAGALYTSVATDASGNAYIAYMDEDQSYKATVKKFSGGSWTTVGTAGLSAGRADYTNLVIGSSGTPYIVYMDESASYKATVKKFNGTAWENVGVPGFSADRAEHTTIATDAAGNVYVAYTDWGNTKKATVMKFNGTSWSVLGSAGFSAGQVNYIQLKLSSTGTPYVVYEDFANSDRATVMTYNGSTWTNVGVAGFSAGTAEFTSITIANDTPFVVYSDYSVSRKATAMKFDGLAWVAAGAAGLTPDRADATTIAHDAAGTPYISYVDWFAGDEATVVRYKNGIWETVGAADFSTGSSSHNSIAIGNNGAMYVAYTDGDAGGKATVMKYDYGVGVITGNSTLCNGNTTTLSNYTGGGLWSSSDAGIASVASGTGVVTANSAGTATISYAITGACGTVTATKEVNVTSGAAPITGTLLVCTGSTSTLADATSGGSWVSSNTSAATIGPLSGIVTGVASGTTIISYITPAGCGTSVIVTVSTMPAFITGPLTVCAGSSTNLSCATPGGIWTSTNTSIATIGSSTGTAASTSAGNTTISYTMPGGCARAAVLTVNATPPAITGVTQVCVSSNTPLANAVPGGLWSSSDIATANVVSSSGVVVGISAGTANISYFQGGCSAVTQVTVNEIPSAISGASSVCVGGSATLTSLPSGGTWSVGAPSLASISSTGVVTGLAIGTPIVTYGFATGCYRVLHFNVSATPSAITGTAAICEGITSTLTSYPPGGLWSSSNANATVGSSSGMVTGISSGTATIVYSLGAGCQQTIVVTVSPSPTPISGAADVCTGSAITMSSSAGGSWSSHNPGTASVGSATGIVTGVTAGATIISYTLPSGCFRTAIVTVVATPPAANITGSAAICEGALTTLTADAAGGIWSTTTGKVSVSVTGDMTGLAGGADTVNYSIPSVCGLITSTHPVMVTALPSAGTIIGATEVCKGQTISLSATVTGGTWKSSNVVVAVVSSTGIVSGLVPGTAVIRYRVFNSCGADTAFSDLLVHPMPSAGTLSAAHDSVCAGDTLRITSSKPDGVWSTSNIATATINAAGLVTGTGAGPVTISYIATGICGADTATRVVIVKSAEECAPASVTELTKTGISIYPNPSYGTLSVATPVSGILSIHTIDGREVQQLSIKAPKATILLPSELAAGFYMCRFTGTDGSMSMIRLVYQP